jgi:hypothetical protein
VYATYRDAPEGSPPPVLRHRLNASTLGRSLLPSRVRRSPNTSLNSTLGHTTDRSSIRDRLARTRIGTTTPENESVSPRPRHPEVSSIVSRLRREIRERSELRSTPGMTSIMDDACSADLSVISVDAPHPLMSPPLNHLSSSIRRPIDRSPSPPLDLETITTRRSLARVALDQHQREVSEICSPKAFETDHMVMSLESLDEARSSISSLTELIRAKESELAARKAQYGDQRKQLLEKEMRVKQIEYLRKLEEEEKLIEWKIESVGKRAAEIDSILATEESMERKTPEIFSIASPQKKIPVTTPPPPIRSTISIQSLVSLGDSDPEIASPVANMVEDRVASPVSDHLSGTQNDFAPLEEMESSSSEESQSQVMIDAPVEAVMFEHESVVESPRDQFDYSSELISPKEDSIPILEAASTQDTEPPQDEEAIDSTTPLVETVTSELISELIDSVLAESCPPVKRPRPTRTDSFDVCVLPSPAPPLFDVDTVISLIANRLTTVVPMTDELSDRQLARVRTVPVSDILNSFGIPLAECISDCFLSVVDSLPPAQAAARAWKIRFPKSPYLGAKNLPTRHTLSSILGNLRALLGESITVLSPEEQVDALCVDFVKRFKSDEVFFQNNTGGAMVIDRIDEFIIDAVLSSVVADFDMHIRQPHSPKFTT